MISNSPSLPIRPGSMGKPVPGVVAQTVDEQAKDVPVGCSGNLCRFDRIEAAKLCFPLPSFSIFLFDLPEILNRIIDQVGQVVFNFFYLQLYVPDGFVGFVFIIFRDPFYRDLPEPVYILFRYRPYQKACIRFEVESALLERREVAEAAVVALPDEVLFEKVVACVVLRDGVQPSEALQLDLKLHVSNRVSTTASPREIVFSDGLPRTRSGKIMRRVVRARMLGQDPGDCSSMDDESEVPVRPDGEVP